MGSEFELKYKATPEIQEEISRDFGSFAAISMETTYYDTKDRILSKQKVTLRRRLENGISICTVKTPEIGGARGEWEVEAAEIEAGLEKLCKLDCSVDLRALRKAGVEPLCGARFIRRVAIVNLPECTAELALDFGVLTGGGKEIPLCEVELELKSGSREALVVYGNEFSARYGLEKEPVSKFRRAMALTVGE